MKGKDIVCAAVSALCIALKSSIMRLLREGKNFSCVNSASDGRFFLEASHFENGQAYLCVNDMFTMFYDGMREIQRLYPENVKLITE